VFNDDVVLWINASTIINLNKEMVDEFYISYLNNRYHVVNMGSDSSNVLSGYVNVYYEGPTTLYVKYRKQVDILAVDNKYDLFVQMHRIYIRKDDQIIQFFGKRSLLKILADRNAELKSYIKQNKLRLTKNEPRTFIPVLEYYDSLRK
jgi:hypothetical protein